MELSAVQAVSQAAPSEQFQGNAQAFQGAVVGQPSTMVRVAVPTGAQPGQQIQFTMPNGTRVVTTVQESVTPGEMLTVAVPTGISGGQQQAAPAPVTQSQLQPVSAAARTLQPVAVQLPQHQQQLPLQHLAPLLPAAGVSLEEADRQATTRDWLIYVLAFPICCCAGPLVAMIIWAVLAMIYFCKPAEERQRRPRQYGPACAAASTIGLLCCCVCLFGLMFLVALAACGSIDSKEHGQTCMKNFNITWGHGIHHDHDHHHPPFFLAKNVAHEIGESGGLFEPPEEDTGKKVAGKDINDVAGFFRSVDRDVDDSLDREEINDAFKTAEKALFSSSSTS
eukprot:TRINITY_DN104729_c0_g1_i1.p1 TRINITY_DN104729_c0_g1~~TRINITY_DN104729_c0_g1_i1.p1  ORF type:complete len:337 (-),score=77.56 TRINITY_DN104729_c0_g1_i1:63-1073(-)